MMKKVNLDHSLFEEIPTAVIWDILSRLPTKACLICKLVCKDWYHIIIDPDFGSMRRSHGCYTTLLLHGAFYNGKLNFVLLDLHKQDKFDEMANLSLSADTMIRFKAGFPWIKNCRLSLANECNGIVCLKCTTNGWAPIVICNLLTMKFVFLKQSRRQGHSVQVYGLGCCPVSRQYKVLRVAYDAYNKSYVGQVQTLGTDDWRTVGTLPWYSIVNTTPSYLKGSLHWFSYKDKCIQSFHFGNEQFSCIELPNEITIHSSQPGYTVFAFDSRLCISYSSGLHKPCSIWVMKEYGVKESWVKQYVFDKTAKVPLLWPLLQNDSAEMLVSY